MDENIMNEGDTVFRSQFEHANRERRRPDVAADNVETDHENGWLNVRVGDGDWAAAPEIPNREIDPAHQGRVEGLPPAGTSPSHDRVTYSDPLADNMDPTDPGAPV